MWPNPLETAEFTFTEENLNGKVHFFCAVLLFQCIFKWYGNDCTAQKIKFSYKEFFSKCNQMLFSVVSYSF